MPPKSLSNPFVSKPGVLPAASVASAGGISDFYKKLISNSPSRIDDLIKEFETLLRNNKDFRDDAKKKKLFLDQIVKKISDAEESDLAGAFHQIATVARNYKISIDSSLFNKKIATLNAQRINSNCLIGVLSGLNDIGFDVKKLHESREFFIAALNRFAAADVRYHNANSIECSVHFLLHIKNLGFINDPSSKVLVAKLLKNISEFYAKRAVGDRVLRPMCEVLIYCRDVLGIKIPQNFENKLATQWSDKDQTITSFLQRNVFSDLINHLEKGGEWQHVPKKIAPNIYKIGGLTIELEGPYGLIGRDKPKAIKYGDIVIKNRAGKIVTIVEVDGPSHYSIIDGERVYAGGSRARNGYILRLVGDDGLVCIDYQEYEKSMQMGAKKEYLDDKFSFIKRLLRQQMTEDEALSGPELPPVAEEYAASKSEQQEVLAPQDLAAEAVEEPKEKTRISVPELTQEFLRLLEAREENFDLDEISRFLTQYEDKARGIMDCALTAKKIPLQIAIDLYLKNPSDYYADLIVFLKIYGFDALPQDYRKPAEEACPPNFFVFMGWSKKALKGLGEKSEGLSRSGETKSSPKSDPFLNLECFIRENIMKIVKGEASKEDMLATLNFSAKAGRCDVVKIILGHLCADKEMRKTKARLYRVGFTEALGLAIKNHHNDIVDLLIEAIKKISKQDQLTKEFLYLAENNDVLAITQAAFAKNYYAIRALVEAGFDPNEMGGTHEINAMIGAVHKADIECVNLLLDCGVQLTGKVIMQIMKISQEGENFTVLKELIAGRKFDIDGEKDDLGNNSMINAIAYGYKDSVILLLDGGADINYISILNNGFPATVLMMAIKYSHKTVLSEKNVAGAEIIKILLDRGADPSLEVHHNGGRVSSFEYAFTTAKYDILRLMLEKKQKLSWENEADSRFLKNVAANKECDSELKRYIFSFIAEEEVKNELTQKFCAQPNPSADPAARVSGALKTSPVIKQQ